MSTSKNTISSEIFNKIYTEVLSLCEDKVTGQLFYVLTWGRSSASTLVSMSNIIEDKVEEYGQANRYHDDPNRPDVYA
jgi:hypothetical protein